MRKEVEVKAKMPDGAAVRKKLTGLGCVFSEAVTQEDTVYANVPDPFPGAQGKDAFAKGINFLRIRRSGSKIVFTLKQPQGNGLDKLEHEVKVSDAEEMDKIILLLGYRNVSLVKKVRQKTNYNGYEICLDEVEELGSFIEVEKITEEDDSEKIQEAMFALLESLGIQRGDRVFHGYDVLMHMHLQQQKKSQ